MKVGDKVKLTAKGLRYARKHTIEDTEIRADVTGEVVLRYGHTTDIKWPFRHGGLVTDRYMWIMYGDEIEPIEEAKT